MPYVVTVAMTPDDLLRLYPGETLPWLRRQMRLSRQTFAAWLGVPGAAVTRWEQGTSPIPLTFLKRIVPLVARYLPTEEGRALLLSLS